MYCFVTTKSLIKNEHECENLMFFFFPSSLCKEPCYKLKLQITGAQLTMSLLTSYLLWNSILLKFYYPTVTCIFSYFSLGKKHTHTHLPTVFPNLPLFLLCSLPTQAHVPQTHASPIPKPPSLSYRHIVQSSKLAQAWLAADTAAGRKSVKVDDNHSQTHKTYSLPFWQLWRGTFYSPTQRRSFTQVYDTVSPN